MLHHYGSLMQAMFEVLQFDDWPLDHMNKVA
jgi:hypothetical protein